MPASNFEAEDFVSTSEAAALLGLRDRRWTRELLRRHQVYEERLGARGWSRWLRAHVIALRVPRETPRE